jgi:hypothetical protein
MTTFILLTFAAYQLTDLLVYQDGPFNLFVKIRNYFGLYLVDDQEVIDYEKKYIFSKYLNRNGYNLVASILSCPYCSMVWVILFLTPFVYIFGSTWLLPFAAMGLVAVLLDYK